MWRGIHDASAVRITLALDDDLAALLRQQAATHGVSFKEMVNRALPAASSREMAPRDIHVPKTIPHSFGFRPGVDLDKLNHLADELEAEATAQSIKRNDDPARRQPTLAGAQPRLFRVRACPDGGGTSALQEPRASASPGSCCSGSCVSRPIHEPSPGRCPSAKCSTAWTAGSGFPTCTSRSRRTDTSQDCGPIWSTSARPGNMTTDAHLATLATQRGYVLHTTDTDFMPFRACAGSTPCR